MAKPSRRKNKASEKRRSARGRRTASRDLPELQQARSLWLQHRYADSLQWFQKAVRKEPGNPLALTDAARAHGARFEISQAEHYLARLREMAGGRADLWKMLGQSYRMVQRPQLAIECLEQALTKLETTGEAFDCHLELALLFERRHRLDAAERHADACLELRPRSPEARFVRARVLRRQSATDDAARLLREVGADPAAHHSVRAQAWSELALICDQQGAYADAMAAVTEAKAVLRPHANAELTRGRQEAERLAPLQHPESCAHATRWRSAGGVDDRPATVLLTGAPRSGTTLLEKALQAHPQVTTFDEQVAFPKYIFPAMLAKVDASPIAFDELDAIPEPRLDRERDRYCRYVAEMRGASIDGLHIVDKNPSMIPLIPGYVRLWPQAKILIAVRDPRDVVLSCYMRYLPLNSVSAQFLTLESTADRFQRDIESWTGFRETLGDQALEVRYEDTVNDLAGTARHVLGFLGLPWDDAILNYRAALSSQPANSPTYEDVARPIYRSSMQRWKNYEPWLAPLTERLQPLVEAMGYA